MHFWVHMLRDPSRGLLVHAPKLVQSECVLSTSEALSASASTSSGHAWAVRLWWRRRLAALVRGRWRYGGGADTKAWRKHCRALVPLPLALQNNAASFWSSQWGALD